MTTRNELWEAVKKIRKEVDAELLGMPGFNAEAVFVCWNCYRCGVGSILLVLVTCTKESIAKEMERIHQQFSRGCKGMG